MDEFPAAAPCWWNAYEESARNECVSLAERDQQHDAYNLLPDRDGCGEPPYNPKG